MVRLARQTRAPGREKRAALSPLDAAEKAGVLLADARSRGETLTEQESKSILAAYGIPVPRE